MTVLVVGATAAGLSTAEASGRLDNRAAMVGNTCIGWWVERVPAR